MPAQPSPTANAYSVFWIFLRLGLTSFGGPLAHLGYFREEFVSRRRWLSEQRYADLVALCQFLPGPASSQVGMGLGLMRCGYRGAFAAWAGFTLPSALAMILLALGIASQAIPLPVTALYGLKIVALAVVAQAVWGMARALPLDRRRVLILLSVTWLSWIVPSAPGQISLLVLAGLTGVLLFRPPAPRQDGRTPQLISPRAGAIYLLLFSGLLLGLPLLAAGFSSQTLAEINAFFQSGALMFGGGHVVLPLLHGAVVVPGWIEDDVFLAGYGAAQAVPGPLFSFAAFLGASMHSGSQPGAGAWLGGMTSLLAIFTPSFLILAGAWPFWEQLHSNRRMQAAMMGVQAAVIGLLLATLLHPLATASLHRPLDIAWITLALLALMLWRLPPWLVVIMAAMMGWIASLFTHG